MTNIYSNYWAYCVRSYENGYVYYKYESTDPLVPDYLYAGWVDNKNDDVFALRFPLTALPSGANVTKVRLRYQVYTAGGAAGLWIFTAYGPNDGQDDPDPDNGATFYSRCTVTSSTNYVTSDKPRSIGQKWETLGDGEMAQACLDVEAAKAAVDRFSLGCYEINQDDVYMAIYSQTAAAESARPLLEITYTLPPALGGGQGLLLVKAGRA